VRASLDKRGEIGVSHPYISPAVFWGEKSEVFTKNELPISKTLINQ
jgi:hypothetical protein